MFPERAFFNFLIKRMIIDDLDIVYNAIITNSASADFSSQVHADTLQAILNHYSAQMERKCSRPESISEEGVAAYLTYVLKRNFEDRSSGFSLPGFHKLKVFRSYKERFVGIGHSIILLGQPLLTDVFIKEILKDLDNKMKLNIFKQIMHWTPYEQIGSKIFTLFLQSFL